MDDRCPWATDYGAGRVNGMLTGTWDYLENCEIPGLIAQVRLGNEHAARALCIHAANYLAINRPMPDNLRAWLSGALTDGTLKTTRPKGKRAFESTAKRLQRDAWIAWKVYNLKRAGIPLKSSQKRGPGAFERAAPDLSEDTVAAIWKKHRHLFRVMK